MKFYKKKQTAREIFKQLKDLQIEKGALIILRAFLVELNYINFFLETFDIKVKRKFDWEFYTKGHGDNQEIKIKIHYGFLKRKSYIVTIPEYA